MELALLLTIAVPFAAGCVVLWRRRKAARRAIPSAGTFMPGEAHVEWLRDDEAIITLRNGQRFRGSSTVWHRYPMGGRPSTELETQLCAVWQAARWSRENAIDAEVA